MLTSIVAWYCARTDSSDAGMLLFLSLCADVMVVGIITVVAFGKP